MIKNQTRDTLRIFFRHIKPYWFLAILTILSLCLAVGAELYRPLLYKQFFDLLGAGGNVQDQLVYIIVLVLITNLVSWIGWRLATYAQSFFAAKIMSNLLNTCFNYIHGHSYDFFSNTFGGSLVRKVNRYARSFEDISDELVWGIGPTALSMIVIIVVLFHRSHLLGIIILVWMVIYMALNYLFILYKLRFDIERAATDTLTSGYLADTITNYLNLKLFGARKTEFKGYKKLTDALFVIRKKTWYLDSTFESVQGFMMVILEFVIMYYAIKFWQQGLLTIGDFALIQAYLLRMFQSLWEVGHNMRRIYESLADAEEMTAILTKEHDIIDVPNATELKVHQGAISFQNVTFGYHDNRHVLKNFNFHIEPGELVALIGPSGGGKSTVVKLLLRFFNINNGQILIDGQNVASVTQDSLRNNIALVPQEPVLFHRTLLENIRYGRPDATKEEVENAAKLAYCHEFIMDFPDGYDTFVGERGVKLSGGERQRVAIARAILKNAPILILDEATSSLDSQSERYIQDALKNLMKGKTAIVIAHRLSTIKQMDRIVVLERGKIREEGTHQQLLEIEKGTYSTLWELNTRE